MRRLPLRWKLTWQTAGLAALVLVAYGLGVSWHLYNDGIADLDVAMHEVARGFFAELDTRGQSVNWNDQTEVDGLFPVVSALYTIEIFDHGKSVYRSRSLGNQTFPMLAMERNNESEREKQHERLSLANRPDSVGRNRRAAATVLFTRGKMRVTEFAHAGFELRLAADLHTVKETREDLFEAYLVSAPIALLLVGVGAWWIAGRALSPIDQIARAAKQITAQHLDRRLPLPNPPGDELARLTMVLNEMFDRLEGSFSQATRFTADASHELKTPLTIIRGEIEAALRADDHTASDEKMLLNLLEETTRLITITEGLLLLTHADAGRLQLPLESIDFSKTITDLVEDMEILAERRSIHIEADVPPGLCVHVNAQFLRQLLLNLFDNAIKYNHTGGSLRVRLVAGTTTHQFCIANTGAALTAEQATHIFDRFYRADSARNRGVSGHGLGLSICREIARAFKGEISVHLREPGWTEFRVALPAAPSIEAQGEMSKAPRPEETIANI